MQYYVLTVSGNTKCLDRTAPWSGVRPIKMILYCPLHSMGLSSTDPWCSEGKEIANVMDVVGAMAEEVFRLQWKSWL
jgi:hypothetical protein